MHNHIISEDWFTGIKFYLSVVSHKVGRLNRDHKILHLKPGRIYSAVQFDCLPKWCQIFLSACLKWPLLPENRIKDKGGRNDWWDFDRGPRLQNVTNEAISYSYHSACGLRNLDINVCSFKCSYLWKAEQKRWFSCTLIYLSLCNEKAKFTTK